MKAQADSPLGQQWAGAVERASEQPLRVGDQYRTSEAFAGDQVEAHIYQVALERGVFVGERRSEQ